MIIGQGIDIVEVKRIEEIYKRFGNSFLNRIFSISEIREFASLKGSSKRIQMIASRFASKEAASKALGVGISSGIRFKDIIIYNLKSGKPKLKFIGVARIFFKKLVNNKKKVNVGLSISHEKKYTVAMVLLSI